jgi:hypothetical protein
MLHSLTVFLARSKLLLKYEKMGPLHEDVHVISREKLLGGVSPGCSGYFVLVSWITPAWGIPNQQRNHVIQFSVMTSSPGRHEPVIPPMRRSLTPDNSDVFGTFLKDQKLNSCKHAIISQLFVIFLDFGSGIHVCDAERRRNVIFQICRSLLKRIAI